ncbi:MFS transporter [Ereboglobus luteus]|uniref:Major facilitator superfamily (MFS) profile domain-containing protein n=1 Tax=Ereboglobus luteus TaxID=1796921 RepID=A0A2U8E5K0_9BACT|nr:MFS transporter [Ereboglobus luteus]AWI09802.1 hypothetical protein CKA38_11560 [Ereboglobus luteus]
MVHDNTRTHKNTHSHFRNWKAWAVVGVFVFLTALASVDRFLIGLVVDPIREAFRLDDIKMGLLQGPVFAIAFLIGSLLMGWIVDRWSSRRILFLGVLVWSAGTIFFGLAASFSGLVFARALLAIGQSVLQPAGWSVLGKLFPAEKLSLALGVLATGTQIGVASSYLLGGFMISWAGAFATDALPVIGGGAPWRIVFLAVGIIGIPAAFFAFAIPAVRASPENITASGRGSKGFGAFVRGNLPFFALHFTGFSLLGAMVHGVSAWMPAYLIRAHSLDIRVVGTIFALSQFPVSCGHIFAGWRVDRSFARGRGDAHMRHFARVAAMAAILGGVGFGFGSSLAAVLFCFAAIQFIQPFSGVAGAALQIATPVEYRGRISAIFIMCYNAVGMTLGPSLLVFLNKYASGENLRIAIALTYALLGGSAAIVLWIGRKYFSEAVVRAKPKNQVTK